VTALDERPITDMPATQLAAYAERVTEITEPGIYDHLTLEQYHGDAVPGGSLSSSGARKMLHPSCPAKFDYERRHPQPPSDAMEFGSAVHSIALGNGAEVAAVDAKSWQGKAAQDERREIRASGRIPLLESQFQTAHEMCVELRRHPIAAKLLDPARGKAERSLFWRDPVTGVMLRARPDWLPDPVEGERLLVPDIKTIPEVDPDSIAKSLEKYSYPMQADFYESGIRALGIAQDVAFLFIFIRKTKPYLIQVDGVPEIDRAIAAAKNRRAINLYAQCTLTGEWPVYEPGIAYIDTPGWAQSRDAQNYL
jgi:PDDEXK-like domain of unknown function (DUF3799)